MSRIDVKISLRPYRDSDNSYPRDVDFEINNEYVTLTLEGGRRVVFPVANFKAMCRIFEMDLGVKDDDG